MQKLDCRHALVALARRAFPAYRGRKFAVCISDRPRRLASYWDGGSRDTFMVFQGNRFFEPPMYGPFGKDAVPDYIPASGSILIEHSVFMGKDAGCTIYLHSSDADLSK